MAYEIQDGVTNTDLGAIQSEDASYDSGTSAIANATGSFEDTEIVKLKNATKFINITGLKTGSLAELQTFIDRFDEWLEGAGTAQESAKKVFYVSELQGTKQVTIEGGGWQWVKGSPLKLQYDLRMLQVSS